MHPVGVALMYEGTSFDNLGKVKYIGTASKCSYCNMMAFTEKYPGAYIKYLGHYVMDTNTYAGSQGYVVHGPYSYNTNLMDDDYLKGFERY